MHISNGFKRLVTFGLIMMTGFAFMHAVGFELLRRWGDPYLACWWPFALCPLAEHDLEPLRRDPAWKTDRFEVEPGVSLDGIVHLPARKDAPWVLYFHGNGSTGLASAKDTFETLARGLDWGFVAWTFRGFGTSTGTTTKENLRADGLRVTERVLDRWAVAPSQLRLMGFSLGSAPAAHAGMVLSERGQAPAGVILMATGWRYGFPLSLVYDPNAEVTRRERIRCPILITHGTGDEPRSVGFAILDFRAIRKDDAEFLLVHGGHNHVDIPEATQRIRDFIEHPRADRWTNAEQDPRRFER
jgi:pimeloyl-ACP methyl ester carboxylesterase